MLLMNIRTAYATSPSYDGLDTETAAAYNLAPNEMVIGDEGSRTLNGTFGGAVDVAAIEGHETYFYITMHSLGKEACRSLATSDWGADGLVSITVQAETGTVAPAYNCTETTRGNDGKFCTKFLPIVLSDLGTSTGDLCGEEVNKITWVYY